jgi:hypothetical protein
MVIGTAQRPGTRRSTAVNKFQRIHLVRLLGLNTEDSVLVEQPADLSLHVDFFHGTSHVSVRTFRPTQDAPYEPHFPFVSWPEFDAQCLPLLDQGYSLIVAKGIDPNDAELAGCILRRRDDFVIEVALGPGTVRRVTHGNKIDLRAVVKAADDPQLAEGLRTPLQLLVSTERRWKHDVDLRDVLYEFSVYKMPVGWRSERVIFWEIRGLYTPDSKLERFYRRVSG